MGKANQIIARERETKALSLAKAGVPYEKIAAEIGVNSASSAWKCVQRALNRSIQPDADEFRKLQMERLNAYRMGIWPRVQKGEPRAIEVAIKIEEREAKLLGIDATQQIEHTGDITVHLKNVDVDAV